MQHAGLSVLTFQKCHWFRNVKGEKRRLPPGYETKDLQCTYCLLQ